MTFSHFVNSAESVCGPSQPRDIGVGGWHAGEFGIAAVITD
jgi:hypothetical protein